MDILKTSKKPHGGKWWNLFIDKVNPQDVQKTEVDNSYERKW